MSKTDKGACEEACRCEVHHELYEALRDSNWDAAPCAARSISRIEFQTQTRILGEDVQCNVL